MNHLLDTLEKRLEKKIDDKEFDRLVKILNKYRKKIKKDKSKYCKTCACKLSDGDRKGLYCLYCYNQKQNENRCNPKSKKKVKKPKKKVKKHKKVDKPVLIVSEDEEDDEEDTYDDDDGESGVFRLLKIEVCNKMKRYIVRETREMGYMTEIVSKYIRFDWEEREYGYTNHTVLWEDIKKEFNKYHKQKLIQKCKDCIKEIKSRNFEVDSYY